MVRRPTVISLKSSGCRDLRARHLHRPTLYVFMANLPATHDFQGTIARECEADQPCIWVSEGLPKTCCGFAQAARRRGRPSICIRANPRERSRLSEDVVRFLGTQCTALDSLDSTAHIPNGARTTTLHSDYRPAGQATPSSTPIASSRSADAAGIRPRWSGPTLSR